MPKHTRGEWVEDSKNGLYTRYYIEETGETTWVCNNCGEEDVDPYEIGCEHCDQEPDMF